MDIGGGASVVEPVTFVLIDHNDGIRQVTAVLVEDTPQVRLVGTAAGAVEAVRLVRSVKPDVVLLDIMTPDVSGLESLSQLLAAAPTAKVLMYSALEDLRSEALGRGAHGWVSKATPWRGVVAEMVRAVGGA